MVHFLSVLYVWIVRRYQIPTRCTDRRMSVEASSTISKSRMQNDTSRFISGPSRVRYSLRILDARENSRRVHKRRWGGIHQSPMDNLGVTVWQWYVVLLLLLRHVVVRFQLISEALFYFSPNCS